MVNCGCLSYLYDRKKFFRVDGTNSHINVVGIGVSQHSCIGPHLFLVYISDLAKVIQTLYYCHVCQSQVSLYLRGASLAQLNETINKDLESLAHRPKGNKLSLTVGKTVSMNILSRQKHQRILGELDLKTRDTNIQNVREAEYLGLQIDEHLTWKKHVGMISR